MQKWLESGFAAIDHLNHRHTAQHTDNLTVMRMKKTGYGCLHCQHCKDLSMRMSHLEQFRFTGECMACLNPSRLANIELPNAFNPLHELELLKRRKQRILKQLKDMNKLSAKQ